LQRSETSQESVAFRHTRRAGKYRSTGQAVPPSHTSLTSHDPAASRQTVPAGATASEGHVPRIPSHTSSTSHGPTAARHTVPASASRSSLGQLEATPSHVSASSQEPTTGRQTTPAERSIQEDEQQPQSAASPPSHVSPGSTKPFPHCGGPSIRSTRIGVVATPSNPFESTATKEIS